MASEWEFVKLSELVTIKHGFAFAGEFFTSEASKNLLLTPGNFRIGGGFKEDKPKGYCGSIPEEYVLRTGDLIVTMTDLSRGADTLGYPALVPSQPGRKFLHNQRLGKVEIRRDAELDRLFLYYLLCSKSYRDEIVGSATGSTVKHTSPSRIMSFAFKKPPLQEQERIGRTLSALDQRIELLEKANSTLEAIARAIFKSWFVDFDPVRAKAEGHGPEGMDAATAALFPKEFEESEIGSIPEGWAVERLENLVKVTKGKSYKSTELVETHTTALVTLKSFLRGGGFNLSGFKPYAGGYKESQILEDGDVVVAYTDVTQAGEVIGRPAMVTTVVPYTRLVASLDVGIVRSLPERRLPSPFIYGLLLQERFSDHVKGYMSGTTVLHLAKNALQDFPVVVPGEGLIECYADMASPLYERTRLNVRLSQSLAALRDTLLPRLISGKLRVPEAESMVNQLEIA